MAIVPLVVTTVAAFLMSAFYYSSAALGNVLRRVDPEFGNTVFQPWKLLIEVPRTFGVVWVTRELLALTGTHSVREALLLSLLLWFGFSALMWVGAVTWQRNPWQVAAIHAGDWLFKIALIAILLTVWAPGPGFVWSKC